MEAGWRGGRGGGGGSGGPSHLGHAAREASDRQVRVEAHAEEEVGEQDRVVFTRPLLHLHEVVRVRPQLLRAALLRLLPRLHRVLVVLECDAVHLSSEERRSGRVVRRERAAGAISLWSSRRAVHHPRDHHRVLDVARRVALAQVRGEESDRVGLVRRGEHVTAARREPPRHRRPPHLFALGELAVELCGVALARLELDLRREIGREVRLSRGGEVVEVVVVVEEVEVVVVLRWRRRHDAPARGACRSSSACPAG